MVEAYLMILPGWPLFMGVKRDENLEQAWPPFAGHVKGFSGRRVGDAINHVVKIPPARLSNDGTTIDHPQNAPICTIYFIDTAIELNICVDPAIDTFEIIDAFQRPSIHMNRKAGNNGKLRVPERQLIGTVAHQKESAAARQTPSFTFVSEFTAGFQAVKIIDNGTPRSISELHQAAIEDGNTLTPFVFNSDFPTHVATLGVEAA